MSPSASGGLHADGSVRKPSVCDSDMDIGDEVEVEAEMQVVGEFEDEDPEEEEEEEEKEEEEEEVEEDPEEEVEEEEEEEEEGAGEVAQEAEEAEEKEEEEKEHAMDSRNSPSKASDFQKDFESDSESNRLVECLGSSSSMLGKFGSCRELNSDTGGLKLTTPLGEQTTTLKNSCLSFKDSQLKKLEKEPTLTEDKGSRESCVNENDSEWPRRSLQPDSRNLKNVDEPKQENVETAGLNNMDICNSTGEKIVDSVPGGICIGKRSNGACTSGNTQSDIKSEDERSRATSRPGSFSSSSEIKEPPHKRAALVCEFFAKGWCIRGKSCRFLHVKDNVNNTGQQQMGNNSIGSREIHCDEERMTSGHGERRNACQLKENTEASLHSREEISMGISTASHSVFPSKEDMGFMSALKDMGRERPKQSCGADGLESRVPVIDDGNSSLFRSSFVPELRSSVASFRTTEVASSQLAWTRSGPFSSFHMNAYASGPQRQLESGDEFYARGSLLMLPGTSRYSHHEPEGSTASKKAQVSSNDWEPSKPFRPSFVVPPSILPSSGTLYDPFLDSLGVQTPGDRSLNASFPSKGEHYRITSHQRKEGNSAGTPQAGEFSDDKNSSCNQNKYEVARVEMVATSVVEQNETMPKEGNSSMPAQNQNNLRKSNPDVGHNAWRRSDGSSNKKILKAGRGTLADDMDGEVRSDAVMFKESKVMRQFRTALIETIKEFLKPMWREGRLSKDVHNLIVKKAAEKVISTAVQFHQVPTDSESVDQYLSLSRPKLIKLVEGYVEKYRKS